MCRGTWSRFGEKSPVRGFIKHFTLYLENDVGVYLYCMRNILGYYLLIEEYNTFQMVDNMVGCLSRLLRILNRTYIKILCLFYNWFTQDRDWLTDKSFNQLCGLHDDVEPVGDLNFNGGPGTGRAPGPWSSAGLSTLLEVGSARHLCWGLVQLL